MSDIKWKQKDFELLWKDKESWKQEDGTYICPICGRKCSKYGIKNHLKEKHFDYPTEEKYRKISETYKIRYSEGKIKSYWKGKSTKHLWSYEAKQKMSNSMKLAHLEGRANNWQDSKKIDNKSYPEILFEKLIDLNLSDKNYVYNLRFGKYSLDFAWPHLKKCIEIDGDQHYFNQERIEHDKIRDIYVLSRGWKVLRVRCKDLYNNINEYINIAKDFIEEDIEHLEDNLENYRKELKEKERINNQKKIDQCHETALKINALIDAKIDFSKWGCIQKASKIIGITPQKTRNWIIKNIGSIV